MHKHVDGIPNLNNFQLNDLEKCATCLQAKAHKNPAGTRSLRDTESHPYQGLYVDFGFPGKISYDDEGNAIETTREEVEGINGKRAWILISDAQTKILHGDARLSKSSPIKYLESFLKEYSPPNLKNRWVMFDQGGELDGNSLIHKLFKKYGYSMCTTGGYSSNSNGPVERAHCTVLDGIKAVLLGAGLPAKFWLYAFYHVFRICNAILGVGQVASSLFLAARKKENFKNLRVFGCCVIVPPLGSKKARFAQQAKKGIFLGYVANTSRVFYWFDIKSQRVKAGTHMQFNKGFNKARRQQKRRDF